MPVEPSCQVFCSAHHMLSFHPTNLCGGHFQRGHTAAVTLRLDSEGRAAGKALHAGLSELSGAFTLRAPRSISRCQV